MGDMLRRAAEIGDATGRTLEGVAYRYEHPSRVTDDGWVTSYYEEILRRADAKSLSEHSEWPLRRLHQRTDPYGTVTFHHSDDESALMFRAVVNDDDRGRSLLGEITDEGWRDVSIGADALQNGERRSPHHGRIVQRRELRLRELSVAPAGVGLNTGAEILMVRSSSTPRLDRLRQRRRLLIPR